ncbi:MAG: hypothetical protein JJU31_05235 [Wenzhouxiangella sp.]|nr:hypothetical protein [Wenzhouxiangella sp.]TVR95187.1 MAG: hypothetical protein EA418_08370 [Wenzhouxiangellaceae bacterium]
MVIVWVPELEQLLRESRHLPALLERFLARAAGTRLEPESALARLVCSLDLAAGPLSRMADSGDDAGTGGSVWLRADPVSLRPDLGAVWLEPGAGLKQAAREALISAFAGEGLALDFPDPRRGYIRLEKIPECRFHPPWLLSGQSLDHVLPSGAEAGRWGRLLNESQVILHQYGQGEPGHAGSLWFWGAGSLPARQQAQVRISHLDGTSPELIGLARWLSLSHSPALPKSAVADCSLVEWPADQGATADDNLERLSRWLQPLWHGLRRFSLDTLELASRERCWRLSPAGSWRLWQRRFEFAA